MPDRRVGMVALGCAKNRAEAEGMLGLLGAEGFTPTTLPEEADLLVVHTCGFIAPAVRESRAAVREMLARRKPGGKVIVSGCLAERDRESLRREFPEVDLFLGTGEPGRVGEAARMLFAGRRPKLEFPPPAAGDLELGPRVLSTPPGTAYIRIAEGCDHRCRFCLIPSLRGPYRSRSVEAVLREARELAAAGVVEVNLVAQDLTRYGRDLPGGEGLPELLDGLSAIPEIRWIRLLYLHPDGITDALLDRVAAGGKVLPYLDVPFQHAAKEVLRRMGRRGGREEYLELIARLRSRVPGLILRSTLMVGFPGETAEAFRELQDFVREAHFDHLGVFVFSPEEGVPAATDEGRPEPGEGRRRRRRILLLQRSVALSARRRLLGSTVPVIVSGATEGVLWGRWQGQAPEEDGITWLVAGRARPGEIVSAKLLEISGADFVGEILSVEA